MKIRKVMDVVTDALFPLRCPICGELPSEEGRRICEACFLKLRFVREPRCMVCGRTVIDEAGRTCAECEKNTRNFSRGCALLEYDDVMRRVVSEIKYNNRRSYVEPFGKLFFLRYGKEICSMGADCLIPVPLHRSRQRSRGFNQAELLAREIGRHAGIPVRTDLLFRTKKTEAQKSLGREERIRNLSEAFSFRIQEKMPQKAILVDDIYTTGSTVEACARVLKRAGICEIFFLSLCIVPEF